MPCYSLQVTLPITRGVQETHEGCVRQLQTESQQRCLLSKAEAQPRSTHQRYLTQHLRVAFCELLELRHGKQEFHHLLQRFEPPNSLLFLSRHDLHGEIVK